MRKVNPMEAGKNYFLQSKLTHFKAFIEQLILSLTADEVLVVEAWNQS